VREKARNCSKGHILACTTTTQIGQKMDPVKSRAIS
jgi:hypothetical protein